MNRIFILATIILLASCKTSTIVINNTAELKEITLNEIWDGTFSPERMNALNAMNGDFYSLLNWSSYGNTTVDKYSYKTLEKVETIVSSSNLEGLNNFSSYTTSGDRMS